MEYTDTPDIQKDRTSEFQETLISLNTFFGKLFFCYYEKTFLKSPALFEVSH